LSEKVGALKEFQQRRFSHTYADLLQSARYGGASRFFLEELYGPSDFSGRDAQFARVVPQLVRVFPSEIVETVATLAQLHALSEALDTAMALHLERPQIAGTDYLGAWKCVDRSSDRQAQIALTLDIAGQLDRFTRKSLLRNSLRLMRGPARLAGLGDLQRFLEKGFDTFRSMHGAREFIEIVNSRERAFVSAMFNGTVEGAAHVAVVAAPPICR
jgi:hypothetical protein